MKQTWSFAGIARSLQDHGCNSTVSKFCVPWAFGEDMECQFAWFGQVSPTSRV